MPTLLTEVVGTPIGPHLAEVRENGNGRLRYYVLHPNYRHPVTGAWTRVKPEIKTADAGDKCRYKCSSAGMLYGFDNDSIGIKRRSDGMQFVLRPLFLTAFNNPTKAEITAGKVEDAKPATALRMVNTPNWIGVEWEGWFTKARIRARIDEGGELHVKHKLDKSLAALGKRYVGTVWQANDPAMLNELLADAEHGCKLLPLTVNGKYYIVEYLDVSEFTVCDTDGSPTGQTQDVEHDYTTISGNLTANLDLQGGATYYLTALCNLGTWNVTSTTASASAHVTIKTNGTSGFRVNGTGTWNVSWVDFTSRNDDSLGEIIVGSTGNPSPADQTVAYLSSSAASSVTMSNWTLRYCAPVSAGQAIGWTATAACLWTLTNGYIDYVIISSSVSLWMTPIIGYGGTTVRYGGRITITNLLIDNNCACYNSIYGTVITIATSLGTTLTNVTARPGGVWLRGISYTTAMDNAPSTFTNCVADITTDLNPTKGAIVFMSTTAGITITCTAKHCFIRNTIGHGFVRYYTAGTAFNVSLIDSCITGCTGTNAAGVANGGAGGTLTHMYNDYWNNTKNCFEALHATEITTNPALGNLPVGCTIDTSLCNRPDGYAIGGFEKNGSDTYDNLGVDEAVYSATGKRYQGADKITMGPMYALARFKPDMVPILTAKAMMGGR